MGPLADRIGNDGVDSERSQNQRKERKGSEQECDEASWRDGLTDDLSQCLEPGRGEVRIDLAKGGPHVGTKRPNAISRAHDQFHRTPTTLSPEKIHLRAGFRLQSA